MKAWILMPALIVLGGCTHTESLGPDWGNSTALNRDAQVLNPGAGKGPQPPHTMDGIKADQAVEEYHSEKADADDERLIRDVSE
ncbi:hypothetical protein KFJ24_05875 [Marinobacter sediminum]|uniref:hypothetical protein n=1 Tax=Marinobacter sediminum TaxID=256323 RepID=UPI0020302546|nr:hypothetical protein [Marinobacter sediminum]MCM0612003.1 hypothetical protein [Marinobacter sediminum]